ncbi:MAG TPA: cupin domain-containing protein [Kofleriaceae bacterium]|nr:cupin domain-containing protein [Kofleriaceae bacterium]
MRKGDVIEQPSEGERFEILRSAHNDGGPLQFEWTLQPGKPGPPEHYHPHEHEIIKVLSGRARITLDGEVIILEAGKSLRMPAGVPHQIRVDGDEPLRCRCTSDQGLYFERILDLLSEGGFKGFSKAAQFINKNPDALVQTQRHIRAVVWSVGKLGWLLGHRHRDA